MNNQPKIAYIVLKYPTVSQTFIQREVMGLCAQGLNVEVYPCLSFGKSDKLQEDKNPRIVYLSVFDLIKFPWFFVQEVFHKPSLFLDGVKFLSKRCPNHLDHWLLTLAGLFLAVIRASYFRKSDICLFHGAWATAPATAAAVLSHLCRKPFSFGGHAYDIYRHGGDPFLDLKLHHASFVHTTTKENVNYLGDRVKEAKIVLARRGLDSLPIQKLEFKREDPLRILSVGRLIAKKGHIYQLQACRLLKDRKVRFQLKIVGDGPLKRKLNHLIDQFDLHTEVELCGSISQAQIGGFYRWANIFWHTGVLDSTGDRDGLPNVVAEAFAYELPVISSKLPGVSEAVWHEKTGLLVQEANPEELAEEVCRLASDGALCRRLAQNGRAWVEENFLIKKNTAILAKAFREVIETDHLGRGSQNRINTRFFHSNFKCISKSI